VPATGGPKGGDSARPSPDPPGPRGPAAPAGPCELAPCSSRTNRVRRNRSYQAARASDREIEQPPATVWHYKSPRCELDLFFYLDLRSGRMRTLHYTLKGEGADATRRQDCLRSLSASRER